MITNIIILSILILSVFFAYRCGFFKSLVNLLIWIAPFILTLVLRVPLTKIFEPTPIHNLVEPLPTIIIFFISLIIVLIIGSFLKNFFKFLTDRNLIGFLDKCLGGLLGFLRGLLIVYLLLFIIPPLCLLFLGESSHPIFVSLDNSSLAKFFIETNPFSLIFK